MDRSNVRRFDEARPPQNDSKDLGATEILHGRRSLVLELWSRVRTAQTVLLYGPEGAGKSAVLRRLRLLARREGVTCGYAAVTASLGDVTAALAQAFGFANGAGVTQRRLRGRLRMAIEAQPGVLLLDGVVGAGSAFKSFLRSLGGIGLGIVMAVDAENERDHARVRSLHLAYRELAIPRLGNRHLRRVLDDALAGLVLPRQLLPQDVRELITASDGLPGRIWLFANRLEEARYWSPNGIRATSLKNEAIAATMERYLRCDEGDG
jgi:hypothetical protein